MHHGNQIYHLRGGQIVQGIAMDESPRAQEESDEEMIERLFLHPGRGMHLARCEAGGNVVDLVAAQVPEMPPFRRVLAMILLLALKDRASEVRLEPWRDESQEEGLRVFYVVDGQLHEMVPPPQYLAAEIIREAEALAGLGSARRRLAGWLRRLASKFDGFAYSPRYGRFRLGAGAGRTDVSVTVYDSASGDRVFLELAEVPEATSRVAAEELGSFFDRRKQ